MMCTSSVHVCIMSSSARLILVICAYIFGLGDFQSDYSAIYMLF